MILFELNEVPYKVLDSYLAQAPHSTIASLLKQSVQFRAICEDKVELDPWISWPTLHRGVNDHVHKILHLGQVMDRPDEKWPPIWRLLSEAGLKVGVFGSLHSSQVPKNVGEYAFYLPDFFDDHTFAHPSYLLPFQRFNLGMTRRSARNVDTGLPSDLLLEFARSAPRLGITFDTIRTIIQQMLSEKSDPRLRIRRRSLQALLMGDVFLSLIRRHKFDFATFYTNHVAANMHRYWAATFPDDYDNRSLSDEWIDNYAGEIFESMDILDKILAKLKRHCDLTGTQLLIATSMGQAAVEHKEARQFVTINNIERFMGVLGFEPDQFRKRYAMVPCGGVIINSEFMSTIAEKLDSTSIDGYRFVKSDNEVTPLSYGLHDDGFVSLFSYFENYTGSGQISIGNQSIKFEDAGFGYTAHEDGVSVTAHHTAEGMLIIYNPKMDLSSKGREVVSTTDIAPAILERFGLKPPTYMRQTPGLLSKALMWH